MSTNPPLQDLACRDCERPANWPLGGTYWFADNRLWNDVNGSPNGFLCPECFTKAAEDIGIAVGWRAGRVGEIEDVVPRSVADALADALADLADTFENNDLPASAQFARQAVAKYWAGREDTR